MKRFKLTVLILIILNGNLATSNSFRKCIRNINRKSLIQYAINDYGILDK